MFFPTYILVSKGKLAKIQLAAHYRKRLKKSDVEKIDLSNAVHEIINPLVKFALRVSAQLLVGVTHIYIRKVDYLLNESNAIMKVFSEGGDKQASINLNNNKKINKKINLTSNDTLNMLNFGDVSTNINLSNLSKESFDKELHVARNEDITLPPPDISDSFIELNRENNINGDDFLFGQDFDPLLNLSNKEIENSGIMLNLTENGINEFKNGNALIDENISVEVGRDISIARSAMDQTSDNSFGFAKNISQFQNSMKPSDDSIAVDNAEPILIDELNINQDKENVDDLENLSLTERFNEGVNESIVSHFPVKKKRNIAKFFDEGIKEMKPQEIKKRNVNDILQPRNQYLKTLNVLSNIDAKFLKKNFSRQLEYPSNDFKGSSNEIISMYQHSNKVSDKFAEFKNDFDHSHIKKHKNQEGDRSKTLKSQECKYDNIIPEDENICLPNDLNFNDSNFPIMNENDSQNLPIDTNMSFMNQSFIRENELCDNEPDNNVSNLNKRTLEVLLKIRNIIENIFYFSSFIKKLRSRLAISGIFYEILILKSNMFIDVEQVNHGEIKITKLAKINKFQNF